MAASHTVWDSHWSSLCWPLAPDPCHIPWLAPGSLGTLEGVQAARLPDHKFLNSPDQEKGFGAGSETTDGQPQGTGVGGGCSQIPQ